MSDTLFKAINSNELRASLEKDQPGCTKTIEIHPPANELLQIPFSSIKPKPIQWLWENRIPRGMITLFAGDPGKGKSQLLLWIASMCSIGGTMPVDGAVFPLGKVAILSAEDDEDVTISPRLHALGANQDLILQLKATPRIDQKSGKLLDGTVCLDKDIQLLDNTFINNSEYVCMIVDPITAYLGETNDYKNTDVRVLMTKLTGLAKKHNISIILNTHLNKAGSGSNQVSAMSRVMGSTAYVAAARAAYLICDNKEDRTIKQFIPMKNNVGDDLTGFEYRIKRILIQDDIKTSHIEWLPNPIQKDANEAICTSYPAPARDKAVEFLSDCLKNGTMLLKDIYALAKENGVNKARLYDAKKHLNLIEDVTTDRYQLKMWSLPK